MRSRRQPYAVAVALCDASGGPSIDLKMVSEIPTKIRGSLDDEAAGCSVIRAGVSGSRLHKSAEEQRTTENQHQENFAREAVFRFHERILAIELRFCQQVAVFL